MNTYRSCSLEFTRAPRLSRGRSTRRGEISRDASAYEALEILVPRDSIARSRRRRQRERFAVVYRTHAERAVRHAPRLED